MKSKIIIISLLILSVVYFSSCSKDDDAIAKSNKESINAMRTGVDPVETKIIEFMDRMNTVREDPTNEESKEWNYSTDSSVWYIEAALNYANAHASWFYETSLRDSTVSTIQSISSNVFNIIELQKSYDQIIIELYSKFEGIEAEHKALLYVDVVNLNGNSSLDICSYMYFGKGQEILPEGEWYIDGNMGMVSPGTYTMGNAMWKIVQSTAIEVLGDKYSRVDIYYTNQEWDINTIPNEPYSGYHYPNFLSGYWLYAQRAYYQTAQPHYFFTNTLTSNQVSFYTNNFEQLGNIRAGHVNKVVFDWDLNLKFGTHNHTSPLDRWMNAEFHLGIGHPRMNEPIVFIQ